MPNAYGAITIPLEAAEAGDDPLLVHTLAFLKAIANAYGALAWNALTGGDSQPVAHTFMHDPELGLFNDNKLPALFLFRDPEQTTFTQETQDNRVERGVLRLLWVPPSTTQEKAARRYSFAGKLFKLLDHALEVGRDPAWIMAGDEYSDAETRGSFVSRYAEFRRLRFEKVRRRMLAIPLVDGTQPRRYEAWSAELQYEEARTFDMTLFDELDAVEQTIEVAEDADDPDDLPEYTITEGHFDFVPEDEE